VHNVAHVSANYTLGAGVFWGGKQDLGRFPLSAVRNLLHSTISNSVGAEEEEAESEEGEE